MAAAKTTKVTLKQSVVILRDEAQVTLKPGEHEVSAAELKVLKEAGLLAEPEAAEETTEGGEQ